MGWIASWFRRNTFFLFLLAIGVICLFLMNSVLLWPGYASDVLNGKAGVGVRGAICQVVAGCVEVRIKVEWVDSEGFCRSKFTIVGNRGAAQPNKADALKKIDGAVADGSLLASLFVGERREVEFVGFAAAGGQHGKRSITQK